MSKILLCTQLTAWAEWFWLEVQQSGLERSATTDLACPMKSVPLRNQCKLQPFDFCFKAHTPLHKLHIHLAFPSLSRIWPQYVKDRIHSTYMYFAGSVGLTALSAVAVSRTPALMGLMMRGSWLVSFIKKKIYIYIHIYCLTEFSLIMKLVKQ